jgi:DNA-binding NtrC family response regulator
LPQPSLPLLILGPTDESLRVAIDALRLTATECVTHEQALQALQERPFLLVVHPGDPARATRVFRSLSGSFPDVPHLLIAAPGDEGAAFDALRAGVDDVLVEPVSPDALRLAVERQLARRSPEELPSPPSAPSALYFGTSVAMREIQKRVARVAPSLATVLVRGESGTGKEKIASEIHRLGPRADRPMVRVHCAALAESLLESELFGHE